MYLEPNNLNQQLLTKEVSLWTMMENARLLTYITWSAYLKINITTVNADCKVKTISSAGWKRV